MNEQMKDTKKGLLTFLNEKRNWFIHYENNPFTETRMVMYISNGIEELMKLDASDDTKVIMYDEQGILKFRVEA